MEYESYKLKNKANIYLVPLKDVQSLTVLVMYPVGSRYESFKLNGASHYIEHLMFKGTKKRKNTLALTREIDRLGAEYNAFTSKEYTGYYIKADSKHEETALDILSDMVFNSTFESKGMEKEKTVIVEELRMYNDNPVINISNIFESLMYKGCPLGWDIGGTEKHVMGYKRGDVLDYFKKYYQPKNMTVVVAGNVTDKTKDYISNYFGKKKNSGKSFGQMRSAEFGSGKRVVVQKKVTDQAQLMLGFPGFSYNNKSNTALGVLNTILGGSMSSRLFIQIREKRGLAYMIGSGVENYKDTGYAYVRAGLESKNINKAIKVVEQEIEKMKKSGVGKQELEDAKTHIRGSLVLSLEDSSVQASWYARQALFAKKIQTPEEKLVEIDRVSNKQIKDLANRVYKKNRMRVAVIGEIEAQNIKF